MPFDATYGARGVEIRFAGRCDSTEVLDIHEQVHTHRYEEGFQYVIVDFSSVEFLDVATADLLRIAEHDRQFLLHNPGYLLVAIAPQAPVSGLMRTFQHFMEGTTLRIHVTSTRDAAVAWLRSEILESA
jgi:anti-anti-sigma regulatory factor